MPGLTSKDLKNFLSPHSKSRSKHKAPLGTISLPDLSLSRGPRGQSLSIDDSAGLEAVHMGPGGMTISGGPWGGGTVHMGPGGITGSKGKGKGTWKWKWPGSGWGNTYTTNITGPVGSGGWPWAGGVSVSVGGPSGSGKKKKEKGWVRKKK